jgi:hypothetical protein
MLSFRKISIVAMVVIALCLSGCGKKEATPDTAGNTPGPLALKIMKLANEGKFEEVKKLMTPDLVTKIESGKKGPFKTIKGFMDFRTKNQTITSMEVFDEGPSKLHPWNVDIKAHYEDGSSSSRVGLYFKLEDGIWKLSA